MRSWVQLAARLYPVRWRKRYGRELEALIEDADPGWRDAWDLVLGAMEMQMATWSIAKTAAVVGLAGALIAAGLILRIPHQYVATGEVQVAADLKGRLPGLQREVLSRSFLAAVIQQEDLYKAERREKPITEIVDRMRRENIHFAPAANGVLRVSFSDQDPARAQRIAHWIVNQMVYVQPAALKIAAAPDLPRSSIPPARWPAIGYGLAAGLLAGALGAWLWRQPWRWTLRMAAFVLGGAVLGFTLMVGWWFDKGPSVLIADHYVSSAVLRPANGNAIEEQMTSRETLRAMVQDARLFLSKRHGGMATDETIDLARRDLRIATLPTLGSRLVTVSFRYTDRYKAQTALREMVDRLRKQGQVETIDPASLPEVGEINEWYFLAFGILLGLAAGLIRINRRPVPLSA